MAISELVLIENQGCLYMSSRQIANLTNKLNKHVCRDIRVLMTQVLGGNESDYIFKKLQQNQHSPNLDCGLLIKQVGINSSGNAVFEYLLNKELTLTLISGYEARIRLAIIRRWQELENKHVWTPEQQRIDEIIKLLYGPVNTMSFEQISYSDRRKQRRFTWNEFQEFFGLKHNSWFSRSLLGQINRGVMGMSAARFRSRVLLGIQNRPVNLTRDFLPKPHQECIQQIMDELLQYFQARPLWTRTQVQDKVREFIITKKAAMERLVGRNLHELSEECIVVVQEYSRQTGISPYDIIQNNLVQLNYDQLALERYFRNQVALS